jgi:hypothetical protein
MRSRKLVGVGQPPRQLLPAANDDSEAVSHSQPAVSRSVPSLSGKTALIVTDDRDMKIENVVTRIVMEDAGLGEGSGPVPYSDFFSKPLKADVLILRSSRVFSMKPKALLDSLERFRKDNPSSAVIVLTFEHHVIEKLVPLSASGVVNMIESRPPCDDLALLRMGGEILRKLQAF